MIFCGWLTVPEVIVKQFSGTGNSVFPIVCLVLYLSSASVINFNSLPHSITLLSPSLCPSLFVSVWLCALHLNNNWGRFSKRYLVYLIWYSKTLWTLSRTGCQAGGRLTYSEILLSSSSFTVDFVVLVFVFQVFLRLCAQCQQPNQRLRPLICKSPVCLICYLFPSSKIEREMERCNLSLNLMIFKWKAANEFGFLTFSMWVQLGLL